MVFSKIVGVLSVVSAVLTATLGMAQLLPPNVAAILSVAATVVAALAKALNDPDGDGNPG